jgi:hypothetical protein
MAKKVKRLEIICLVDPPFSEALLSAETASGNQKPAKSATLNTRLEELDEALAAKRVTRAEHKRLRARILAQF